MASPQLENGYTRMANELYEAIMTSDFSKRQRNVLDLVIRLSYGCGKRNAILRPSDYEIVGVGRNHIKDTLKELKDANVLVINGDVTHINKDYKLWKISKVGKSERLSEIIRRNLAAVPEMGTEIPETGTEVPETGIGEHEGIPETGTGSSQNGNSTVPETGIGPHSKLTIGKRFRLPKETLNKLKETYKRSFLPPKKGEGRGRDSPKYKFHPEHMELARFILNCIRRNKADFKEPNLESWANEIRLMIENDKRSGERVKAIMEWCQSDSFWRSNILSPGKLREKFDQLELRMGKSPPGNKSEPISGLSYLRQKINGG
jgi:phage replication O-like protein O